ncbi:cell wall hydrolase [Novosphingobium aquiterrae]|uniref:Cell wall hydrolase n=1 Tax=Novosphingobium aquiterrae TaxID=624388 RepID=A0ABV6PKK3_9SPHN
MAKAKARQATIAALLTALIAALAVVLGLSLERPLRVATTADTPIATLPGLPQEAPVLAQEPVMPADEARARNAADPFFSGPIAAAAPFRFAGSPEDFDRARECLALAAMAEAGGSDEGQRAVLQVILNRVRHPAFAKTVCGVVFEGAQRATGCQFSFTCDGSLSRQYGDAAWSAARRRAEEALKGHIFAAVGNATHYHTDWVYPYWSPRLVKLAQVDTHLFYRWPGYWGTPGAMRIAYRGGEPDMETLRDDAALPASPGPVASFAPLPPGTPKVSGGEVKVRDITGRGNFLLIANHDAAEAAANARKLCGASATCRVLGWSDAAAIPATFPVPPASRAAQKFSYSRDPSGAEIVLYSCEWFKSVPREQCIPRPRN